MQNDRRTANIVEKEPPLSSRWVGFWLLALVFLVLGQVLLGGITRLSDSGLSIMEWAPIMGALPPFNEEEWQRLFAIYQKTGEYRLVNSAFDLDGFKTIFWWEYLHRLWARLLAPAFLIPYVWFWAKGWLELKWRLRLAGIFALGGLQGLMGWLMVKSGFSERIDVSQYRLLAHLFFALVIYGLLLWSAFSFLWPAMGKEISRQQKSFQRFIWLLVFLIAMQILLGGLVAGLDAGLVYNSFPLMGTGLIPPELGAIQPWWLDPFENPATAQFLHRAMAGIALFFGLALGLYAIVGGMSNHKIIKVFLVLMLLQVGLGITTLMLVVPVSLAVTHQALGFLLWGVALRLAYRKEPA